MLSIGCTKRIAAERYGPSPRGNAGIRRSAVSSASIPPWQGRNAFQLFLPTNGRLIAPQRQHNDYNCI